MSEPLELRERITVSNLTLLKRRLALHLTAHLSLVLIRLFLPRQLMLWTEFAQKLQ